MQLLYCIDHLDRCWKLYVMLSQLCVAKEVPECIVPTWTYQGGTASSNNYSTRAPYHGGPYLIRENSYTHCGSVA